MKSRSSTFTFTFITMTFSLLLNYTTFHEDTSCNTNLEDSVLWEVSHKDLSHNSYLLGTIHEMCADEFFIPEKVIRIINSVDHIAFEVNMSDTKELMTAKQYIIGEKKLTQTLTQDQQDILDQLLKSNLGISLEQVDSYTLAAIWAIVLNASLPCKEKTAYEMELLKMGQERELVISGLETIAAQFTCLNNSFTTEGYFEQLKLLPEYKAVFLTAFEDYKKEDIQAVGESYTNDTFMDSTARYWSLYDRNIRWAEVIPDKIENNSVLIAVGAAHLIGEIGLINLLRIKGYEVTPVY